MSDERCTEEPHDRTSLYINRHQAPRTIFPSLCFPFSHGFFSIARGENAGVELTAESLTWWKTGAFAMRRSVKLSDLRSIQYRRQDDDVVYLNLRDKQTIRVDNRCIGNLCELIREIQVRCPDLRIACTLGPECKSEG